MRQKIRQGMILISFLLFPITLYYFSPYLIVAGTIEGVMTGSFIVFCLMFIFSIFFGRLFCGWLCPAGGLQEMCFKVKDKSVSQKYDWLKFLIWVPWILLIVLMAYKSGGYKTIDFLYQTNNGISVGEPMAYIVFYAVIILIVSVSFIFGRRVFCHRLCWMAPFMILGNKLGKVCRIPSVALSADKSSCINCLTCSKKCPMSLNVNDMVQKNNMFSPECILCGTCVDSCPKKVIKYKIK
jgi:ferredoxin-type protein NapH